MSELTLEEKVEKAYSLLQELRTSSMPTVSRNADRALASVWQIVNNLGLDCEQTPDEGIRIEKEAG